MVQICSHLVGNTDLCTSETFAGYKRTAALHVSMDEGERNLTRLYLLLRYLLGRIFCAYPPGEAHSLCYLAAYHPSLTRSLA